MKKLITVFIVLCLCLCSIGVCAQEADTFHYTTATAQLLTDGVIPPQPTEIIPISLENVAVSTYSSETEPNIYSTIYNGLLYHEEKIDISAFKIPYTNNTDTGKLVGEYMSSIINYFPELFAVDSLFGYDSSNVVLNIYPTYRISIEDYSAALMTFVDEITKIVSGMPADFSDLEKIVYVHDYFAEHYEYDKTLYDDAKAAIYDAYNFFVQHKGVCQAYTMAFTAIMREVGIECVPALDDPDNHAWNIVGLNGKYYHVDNTWDDPGYISGHVSHEYLLLSNSSINKSSSATSNGGHSEWYVPGETDLTGFTNKINDTTYENYAWTNSESSLNYYDGTWYMLHDKGIPEGTSTRIAAVEALNRSFIKTNVSSPDISSSLWWDTTASQKDYYSGFYSGMNRLGNTLYGNTFNSLWSYNIDTGAIDYYSIPDTDHIYGSTYGGAGKITYSIKTDPNTFDENFLSYQLILGDTNGDGKFLANDLINAKKLLLTGFSVKNWGLIDLNEDGKITISDYIRMKKLFAGV